MADEKRAGISISAKAFLASFCILFALMVGAGILTRVIPSGRFDRAAAAGGRAGAATIDAGSYREVPHPDYPAWRWFTAPFEVFGSEDAPMALTIIAFIAIVGGSFAVLQKAGILEAAIEALRRRFGGRKRLLLALVTLFFMLIGALMGVFEEVIPLVPVAIALSISLGWDVFVGLGMSILAVNFGFSAAITNPFTIGVAQRLAGVPVFSGAAYRVFVFVLIYGLYLSWLLWTAKRAERKSLAAGGGPAALPSTAAAPALPSDLDPVRVGKGVRFFGFSALALLAVVMLVSLTKTFSDYSMPITAVLFLLAGCGSGFVAGLRGKKALKAFGEGILGFLPGVALILMALGVKRIIVQGEIIDTILNAARLAMKGSGPYGAAALVYLVTLAVEFFVNSATAKAFLLMPILAPLADLSNLTRQAAVQAYVFGDGFSNMVYPTNAVLLISLGIAGLSWPAWFRKTGLLQLGTFIVTMALLMLAVAIGYN
jgi:uncharacterized ion transporter superfamily protein YfcC